MKVTLELDTTFKLNKCELGSPMYRKMVTLSHQGAPGEHLPLGG